MPPPPYSTTSGTTGSMTGTTSSMAAHTAAAYNPYLYSMNPYLQVGNITVFHLFKLDNLFLPLFSLEISLNHLKTSLPAPQASNRISMQVIEPACLVHSAMDYQNTCIPNLRESG